MKKLCRRLALITLSVFSVSLASCEQEHTHIYTENTVSPTCTEEGYTDYTCECGHTYRETKPAIGHSYTESVKDNPTCEEEGLKEFVCSNDSTHTYTEVIPAKGHQISTSIITDEEFADVEKSSCSACDYEEFKVKFVDEINGKITYDENSKITSFYYEKDNIKLECENNAWTLTIGEIVAPITFEDDTCSVSMIYNVIKNLPNLDNNTSLAITVETAEVGNGRMGVTIPGYRIVYDAKGGNEFSYKPYFMEDSLKLLLIQLDKEGKTYYSDSNSNVVYYTINEKEPSVVYKHCAPDGTVLDIRAKKDGIYYIYTPDGETLVKAQKDTTYYDGDMNEISEAEWYSIPLNYSYLWNAVWAEYGSVKTTHNGGTVEYTLNSDSTVNTFEYQKDNVKVTYADSVWTLTVGEVVTPITFEDGTYSLRMIYRIIDNLPELDNNTSLAITVETTEVGNGRMGVTIPGYRIAYEAMGGNEFSYKPYFMEDSLKLLLIQLDKEGKTYYSDSNSNVVYYTINEKEPSVVYKHCAPDGTVLDIRAKKDGIYYIYTPDGETLVKAQKDTTYYDGDMNEISEAEWYSIPLNYSYLWNAVWAEYGSVKTTHNGGTVEYTLNSDSTVNTFEYQKDNVKVTYADSVWTLTVGEVVTPITFEDGTYSLRMIYRIIDNLPDLTGVTALDVLVESTVLDGSRMGVTADIYRVIYTLNNSDGEIAYKYSILKSNLQTVLLHVGKDGKNNFYTMDGTLISSINTTTTEDENGYTVIYREHCDSLGNVVNVRVLYQGVTYYLESDGETLIKAQNDTTYYDDNMNEISEAEWFAIPLNYSYIWNEVFAELGVAKTTYNGGSVEYTLNSDTTVNTFVYEKDNVKVTYADSVWTVTVGEVVSPITFEDDTYSLRMIYRIIDNLPDLTGVTALDVLVESTLLDGSRMGVTADIYRVIYTLNNSDGEIAYKYSILKSNLQTVLLHVGKDGKNNFYTMDGTLISSINTTTTEDENGYTVIYREHCDSLGNVVNVRVLYQGVTYYLESDGETLIKAQNDTTYYDDNMNEISEAEWFAIPLNYSYIWNEVFAELGVAKTTYNGGSVEYTLNSDSTVNTFVYECDDFTLIKNSTSIYYVFDDVEETVSDYEEVTLEFMLELIDKKIDYINSLISGKIDLSATNGLSIEGTIGEYSGLNIDATNGKFADNAGGWVQVNAGTIISFNARRNAIISIVAYSSADNFEIVNQNGVVTITCKTNDYLKSISVLVPIVFDEQTTIDLSQTNGLSIQGSVGEYQGLIIDATNGKFADNTTGWVQVNAGTIIKLNIIENAVVSLVAHSSADNFEIVNQDDTVIITCKTNDYISSITVSYE